jgi:hypothetical protein
VIPGRFAHVEPAEPAEQQVDLKLFDQHGFTANGIERLKQHARDNRSGAIGGRPALAYISSNSPLIDSKAASTMARIGRNGCRTGTRSSIIVFFGLRCVKAASEQRPAKRDP